MITRVTKLTIFRGLMAALLIGCGVIAFTEVPVVGILFISMGIGLLSVYKGVHIDMTQKRIKDFQAFFWIPFGDWHSLKDYKYVVMSTVSGGSAQRRSASFSYVIFLTAIDRNKHQSIILYDNYNSQQELKEHADRFGKLMELPVKSNLAS